MKEGPLTPQKLVGCGDYNGHADGLFMMKSDDFRLSDERFSANYTVLGDGRYDHKARTLTVGGSVYRVYADWSLKEVDPATLAREDGQRELLASLFRHHEAEGDSENVAAAK